MKRRGFLGAVAGAVAATAINLRMASDLPIIEKTLGDVSWEPSSELPHDLVGRIVMMMDGQVRKITAYQGSGSFKVSAPFDTQTFTSDDTFIII